MDWVHCNQCFVQPGDVDMKKFFITNCGHIYCDECLKMNLSQQCKICHIKFTTIPLTSNMKAEVEAFFRDPIVDLKKQIKILEFQQSQRHRLVSYMRDRIKNYKTLKNENFSLNTELNLCKQENITLRDENQRLKEDLILLKRNHEFSTNCEQVVNSQIFGTPRTHCCSRLLKNDSQYMTPKTQISSAGSGKKEPNFSATIKRAPASNYFVISDSKTSGKYDRMFTTPDIPRFSGPYRSNKISTPDTITPPTPESLIRDHKQGDPLQRKVRLPSFRNGPSPAFKLGFNGLSLSRPTSTPNKELITAKKYLK